RNSVVTLYNGYVTNSIADMLEQLMVMFFNRRLTIFGLSHDELANHDINHTKHHEYQRHSQVHAHCHRNKRDQSYDCGEMLAHEFEPERKQRIRCSYQRMKCVGCPAFLMP